MHLLRLLDIPADIYRDPALSCAGERELKGRTAPPHRPAAEINQGTLILLEVCRKRHLFGRADLRRRRDFHGPRPSNTHFQDLLTGGFWTPRIISKSLFIDTSWRVLVWMFLDVFGWKTPS